MPSPTVVVPIPGLGLGNETNAIHEPIAACVQLVEIAPSWIEGGRRHDRLCEELTIGSHFRSSPRSARCLSFRLGNRLSSRPARASQPRPTRWVRWARPMNRQWWLRARGRFRNRLTILLSAREPPSGSGFRLQRSVSGRGATYACKGSLHPGKSPSVARPTLGRDRRRGETACPSDLIAR